jgi:hypothetical protein
VNWVRFNLQSRSVAIIRSGAEHELMHITIVQKYILLFVFIHRNRPVQHSIRAYSLTDIDKVNMRTEKQQGGHAVRHLTPLFPMMANEDVY